MTTELCWGRFTCRTLSVLVSATRQPLIVVTALARLLECGDVSVGQAAPRRDIEFFGASGWSDVGGNERVWCNDSGE